MKSPLMVAALFLLAGCVSVTPPVSMGQGRYMISLNAHGGFQGSGELLTQTIARANEFCVAQRMHANVLTTHMSGVQMWTPQDNQVVFRCVSDKAPAGKPTAAN